MCRIEYRLAVGIGLVLGLCFASHLGAGQESKTAVPGQPLHITVNSDGNSPSVSLVLGERRGKVTPVRSGYTHTGGGNIDVQQPSPDTVVITMSGVAVAYGGPTCSASASQVFDLVQQLSVSFNSADVKTAKLTLEGRLIGFLRSHKVGDAQVSGAATIAGTREPGIALAMPGSRVSGCESLSINDHESPPGIIVKPGSFTLTQTFTVSASMPHSLFACKAPSAEFAPDPAMNPRWISPNEPFKGAKKADLGFQVTVKVVPESVRGK